MSQGEGVKRVWQALGAARNEVESMYTSTKRMILTKDGKVVEAGPGVSGNLIVAEGCQIPEDMARKHGLLAPEDEAKNKRTLVAPIIVRGREGAVGISGGPEGVKLVDVDDQQTGTGTQSTGGSEGAGAQTSEPTGQAVKPWEGQTQPSIEGQTVPTTPGSEGQQPGTEGGALKVDE